MVTSKKYHLTNERILGNFEFHISREARQKYQFEDELFSLNGNVILVNSYAAKVFAKKVNDQKELVNHPEKAVKAGEINAIGLMDEIMHYLIGLYRNKVEPKIFEKAMIYLEKKIGELELENVISQFIHDFPPMKVYNKEISLEKYLSGESNGLSNRQIILEELFLLGLENRNPAFHLYKELFNDHQLKEKTDYEILLKHLQTFFSEQPKFGPNNQDLIELLQSPSNDSPDSIAGQLNYIKTEWGEVLGNKSLELLNSIDLIREEEKVHFGFGPGPAEVYEYQSPDEMVDGEGFSQDQNWMSELVLIAKNTYVWLDQLSNKYKIEIQHLDQIPDEELDILADQGINGLWLIGLWERSKASKRIKQIMGNHDAVASAYSLYDYQIAEELGGEEALTKLKNRAKQRGIKLASDMVPNHMGIDSRWIKEHPDWFLSLENCPFPSYSFNGEDLSLSHENSIFLEDHYYDKADAAVVFKHVDYVRGKTMYIYHGNDGTNMPWNDTAQLNFLKSEVREAVLQTIVNVAKQFPIIRFDAAMTLAKKHIQRLWFPEPGQGGDIPSRAGFGLSKKEFDKLIPKEFWREVVDRIAQEAPDTLLLAEAFWMMEGYFVRSLGMHRVYNSAFMHMLRDEENAKYRQLIRNTLQFDPQILKRFVNFMNNPDEKTAIEQYGKGDKYFGICTMMATLPGLPMLGHGQIEGLKEKYGMEYKSAKQEEDADQELIDRHQRQIFPLLHQRKLFAGVDNFYLYDLVSPNGTAQENVFAYSNCMEDERSLVIYHNNFSETKGWIKSSVQYNQKSQGEEDKLVQKNLGDGLELPKDPNAFVIFRDFISKKEYIKNCLEIHEKGIYAELMPYQTYVFINFQIVKDNEGGSYSKLTAKLGGKGVESIELELQSFQSEEDEVASQGAVHSKEENNTLDPTQLKIIYLASEASPFVKVGGLGDVAGSLPLAIRSLDSNPDIRLVIPMHGSIDQTKWELEPIASFQIKHLDSDKQIKVFQVQNHSIPVYLIGGDIFQKERAVYLQDAHQDVIRYTLFSLAVVKLLNIMDWKPDIIHANDWHTASAITEIYKLRKEGVFFQGSKTLISIHNLPYLGNEAGDVLTDFALNPPEKSALPGWANTMPLPLGMLYADHINAVSEGYAKEIRTKEFGSGLEKFISSRSDDLSGIVNGLDVNIWDPSTDIDIEYKFNHQTLTQKLKNKEHFLTELGLDFNHKTPLLSIISRMDYQKGIDIAIQALKDLDEKSWQLVILGSGDPKIEAEAIELAGLYPDRVRTFIKYDERLARKIYASSDMILIPSRYEPCGLTQMIGMRYGCVPIARATGGLSDTIKDYFLDNDSTGFLFDLENSKACKMALTSAIEIYADQRKWLGLQRRGMEQDFSWLKSAKKYRSLYRSILE